MTPQADAEEHLRVIRSLMERSTNYRAISAQGALVGGLLALGTGVWMYSRAVQELQGSDCVSCTLTVWGIVLAVTALANVVFLWLDERRRAEPLFSPRARWAFRALAPGFLLAAAGTLPLAYGDLYAMGLLWSGCYAVALLATGHFAPRSVTWLGRAFLAATLLGLLLPLVSPERPLEENALLQVYLAATFGLFHLVYAICTWPRRAAATADV